MALERLTERARVAVALATEEAGTSRREIGPELLLIGLAREGEGVAAGLLAGAGLDEAVLRRSLGVDEPADASRATLAAFSREGAAVLRTAHEIAARRGGGRVGTEHLLLGVLRAAPGSAAAAALAAAGVDERRVEEEVARMGRPGDAAGAASASALVELRTLVEVGCPACGEGRLELAGGDVRTSRAPLGVEARGLAGCTVCGAAWEVDYLIRWRPLELPPGE